MATCLAYTGGVDAGCVGDSDFCTFGSLGLLGAIDTIYVISLEMEKEHKNIIKHYTKQ